MAVAQSAGNLKQGQGLAGTEGHFDFVSITTLRLDRFVDCFAAIAMLELGYSTITLYC